MIIVDDVVKFCDDVNCDIIISKECCDPDIPSLIIYDEAMFF